MEISEAGQIRPKEENGGFQDRGPGPIGVYLAGILFDPMKEFRNLQLVTETVHQTNVGITALRRVIIITALQKGKVDG